MTTTTIVLIAIAVLVAPFLVIILARWLRLSAAIWTVLFHRLAGSSDPDKNFEDEVVELANNKSEYAKMKREYDEQHERARKWINEGRSKQLRPTRQLL